MSQFGSFLDRPLAVRRITSPTASSGWIADARPISHLSISHLFVGGVRSVIVGCRDSFGIECEISEAFPIVSQRALGYFVIYLGGNPTA